MKLVIAEKPSVAQSIRTLLEMAAFRPADPAGSLELSGLIRYEETVRDPEGPYETAGCGISRLCDRCRT